MYQGTLTAPCNSPGGDPTHVPSNSASEGECITRTCGGSCYELSTNITWSEKVNSFYLPTYMADVQICSKNLFWRWILKMVSSKTNYFLLISCYARGEKRKM